MSKSDNRKLKIGITIGDVNGIGPELILNTFRDQRLKEICTPILYGSSRVLNIYRKILGIEKFVYTVTKSPNQAHSNRLNVIECIPNLERVDIGKPSESGGKAAFQAMKRAIEDAQHRAIDALVTLPVDKETFQRNDAEFVGHTEMLAKAFSIEENLMMMVSDEMRIGLVTNHLPITEVPKNISAAKIKHKLRIMVKSLRQDFNIEKPHIAVLGLNPHAGDNGLTGKEEQEIIMPAIKELNKKHNVIVTGSYPADGFFGSLSYKKFDGILAMYHDQGLIPFKLLSGFSGVNFTAGIPLVRTSPDHGVAYDIAGKNIASTDSFREAIYAAIDIFRNRMENQDLEKNALRAQKIDIHEKELTAKELQALSEKVSEEEQAIDNK